MENRVLTPGEVRSLPDGNKVWVEVGEAYPDEWAGIHTTLTSLGRDQLIDRDGMYFYADQIGTVIRVWSLPQPPTPAELAANPWP